MNTTKNAKRMYASRFPNSYSNSNPYTYVSYSPASSSTASMGSSAGRLIEELQG